nr:unnamed protein product [Digitaria exilis]
MVLKNAILSYWSAVMSSAHFFALLLCACVLVSGTTAANQNDTGDPARPAEVRIGALFTFDSVIGKAVMPAIELAVAHVNADPSILRGTNLSVLMQDTNCSGFVGTIEATDPTLSSLEYPYFVRATQSDYYQMGAIASIISQYQWKQVIAIYVDDDYGRGGITALGDLLAKRKCKIAYKAKLPRGAANTTIEKILMQVNEMESRVYVIHVNPDSGLNVFSAAKSLGMMSSGYGVLVLRQHVADSEIRKATLSKRNNLTRNGSAYYMRAYDSVWFSFSTMFFAHRENTVSALGRFVLPIWLFVVLIINSSYTASLTSLLTVQELTSGIQGLDNLISSSSAIGYQVGSFSRNYLVNELNIAESRLVPLNSPSDYARALELGSGNGGVAAIIDELPYVDIFLSKYCKFKTVGQVFTKSGWGFAFPRDSPLAEDLSTAILTLSENGNLQRIHDEWLSGTECSADNNGSASNSLSLSSFWGLFLICGLACLLALVIFFLRIFCQYSRYSNQVEVQIPEPQIVNRPARLTTIKSLISFVDKKEEEVKNALKKRPNGSQHPTIGDSQHPNIGSTATEEQSTVPT